jgi:alpha-galactosidase
MLLVACSTQTSNIYDARIQDKEILTPLPAKSPRINGPNVYGARPGKKFLYRIPCQGERPIRFEAKGLPTGLTLDADKGILRGKVSTDKGDYTITFMATNAYGQVSRSFKLVVGDKMALTPPTG